MPRSLPSDSPTDRPLSPRVEAAVSRLSPLSETETRILSFYQPGSTAEDVVARASASGFSVDPVLVAAMLTRLAHLGVVEPPAAITEAYPPAGTPDVMPMMRMDLIIAKHSAGGGVREVTDPINGRAFTLYDFEVSIAQMLNGQRSAQDVIEAAGKIGIPVTDDSLQKFIRQLRAYGFLRTAVAGEAATTPARGRRVWSPEVRGMFQSALRLSRSGRIPEALDYTSALLQIDPGNQEALELKAQLELKLAGAVEVEVDFEHIHGAKRAPPRPAAEPSVAARRVEDSAAAILVGEPDAAIIAEHSPAERSAAASLVESSPTAILAEMASAATKAQEPAQVAARPAVRRRRLLAVAGATAVLLAFPVPAKLTVPAELTPVEVAVPLTPRAGVLASVDAADGAVVTKGQVLARLNTTELERSLQALVASTTAARQQLDALVKTTQPKWETFARAVVDKKQQELAALTSRRDASLAAITGESAAEVKKRNASAALFAKFLALKEKELDGAQKMLARVTHADARSQLTAQIAGIDEEMAKAKDAIAASVIAAPEAGVFMAPPLHNVGAEVGDRQPYGRVTQQDTFWLGFTAPVPLSARLGAAKLTWPGGPQLSGVLSDGAPPQAGRTLVSLPHGQPLEGAMLEIPLGRQPAARWLFQLLASRG